MNQASVLVYKDANGRFFPSGCTGLVNCGSAVLGTVYLATEDYTQGTVSDVKAGDVVRPEHPVTKMAVIKVTDPDKGLMYIGETRQSLADKCQPCCNTTVVEEE